MQTNVKMNINPKENKNFCNINKGTSQNIYIKAMKILTGIKKYETTQDKKALRIK